VIAKLDAIVDVVLGYRPKKASKKAAKKRSSGRPKRHKKVR
jgi:hypothetical protein